MNQFGEAYDLTSESDYGSPTFLRMPVNTKEYMGVSAGGYNHGLLTICGDRDFPSSTLRSWNWLVGNDALPIALLAWGDFICASFRDRTFYLVLCQEKYPIAIGNSLNSVFEKNLSQDDFIDQLMLASKFELVRNAIGDVPYGKCYVHTPWEMLGGSGAPQGYSLEDAAVYIDLVGQEWQRRMKL